MKSLILRSALALSLCAVISSTLLDAQWHREADLRPAAVEARDNEAPVWIPPIDPTRFLDHVKYLASDDLQGRGNGTPGLEKAADYIGARLRAAGLDAGGASASFYQPFDLVAGLQIQPGNLLVVESDKRAAKLSLGEYYPLSLSQSIDSTDARYGTIDLPLVFAGYGLVAPSVGYDDYAGIDVTGKAVLAFAHAPTELAPGNLLDSQDEAGYDAYDGAAAKAAAAHERGASLLILIDDPTHHPDPHEFEHFSHAPSVDDFEVAVLRVRRDRVTAALGDVIDLTLAAQVIARTRRPQSRSLGSSHVRLVERYTRVRARVRNVVGVLRGQDPRLAQEAIVVGAHYDHVGLGGPHSLAPNAIGQVHNGADDNASGIAALLEMAYAAAHEGGFPRTVVFVAFAGEELGLLGSTYYVTHPTVPIERTVAMVNLDMIGRPGGRILITGLDEPLVEPQDVRALRAVTRLEIRPSTEGYGAGSSDDASFSAQHVPTVGFFSGFHEDYHRPTDDWPRIDATGGAEVAKIALTLVRRLAERHAN